MFGDPVGSGVPAETNGIVVEVAVGGACVGKGAEVGAGVTGPQAASTTAESRVRHTHLIMRTSRGAPFLAGQEVNLVLRARLELETEELW